MERQLRMLGWFWATYSLSYILFLILAIGGLLGNQHMGQLLFKFLLYGLLLICGIGLAKGKTWPRIPAILLSFFNLLNIPIGTVLGLYSIWVLLRARAALGSGM
jgi:hypothetical protein